MQQHIITYDHQTKTHICHAGKWEGLIGENHECQIEMVYRHRISGQVQRAWMYYLTTNKQSLEQTIQDAEGIATCYEDNRIEFISAKTNIKVLPKERLDYLVEAGEVKLDIFNVRVEYDDFKFKLAQ